MINTTWIWTNTTNRNLFKALIVAIAFIAQQQSEAQFVYTTHSNRNTAMGGCFMYDFSQRHLSVDYRQAFMLKGMADKKLSLIWPTGHFGTALMEYNHHGDLDYHEQASTLGYGLNINSWLMVGIAARYLHIGVSNTYYEPQQWLQAITAARVGIGDKTAVSFLFGNRPWDINSIWLAHLQLAFNPTTRWLVVTEIEHGDRTRLRCGIEYSYNNMLAIRAGMATHPMVITFGTGLRHDFFNIDIAVEAHQTLGLTPSTSLTIWF